jgi:hypothetical protein
MTKAAIVLATLLITTAAGFAEDAPKTGYAAGDPTAAEAADCFRKRCAAGDPTTAERRTRIRQTGSSRPLIGQGYDARVMAPTYLPRTAR